MGRCGEGRARALPGGIPAQRKWGIQTEVGDSPSRGGCTEWGRGSPVLTGPLCLSRVEGLLGRRDVAAANAEPQTFHTSCFGESLSAQTLSHQRRQVQAGGSCLTPRPNPSSVRAVKPEPHRRQHQDSQQESNVATHLADDTGEKVSSSEGEGGLPSPAPGPLSCLSCSAWTRPPRPSSCPPSSVSGSFSPSLWGALAWASTAGSLLWAGPLPAGLRWAVTSICGCQALSSEGPRAGPGPEHPGSCAE